MTGTPRQPPSATPASTFHVTLQFSPDGPSVEGSWGDAGTALRKFRSWVGTHGSRDGVVIKLTEQEADGRATVLRIWTMAGGEEVLDAGP
ncbi:hypothetical protein ABT039_22265 [Streptomyces lasiicapitis]|uniref:hypothetical protein n=1 Tax=Streptomyces lasiicapitis TaxID=1923961 RepID=UPI0033294374